MSRQQTEQQGPVHQHRLPAVLPVSYGVVVEEAPVDATHTYPPTPDTTIPRARFSTTMALVMAILGSSVLPVSYAFAKTGIAMGFLVSLVVALSNTYTCHLLLRAALVTGSSTFEELAWAIGGRPFQTFAQVSNVILLLGNLTGDMCLLADLGSKSLTTTLGPHAPAILVADHGRGVMCLLALAVILPLSLFRGMRALEYVSSAGVPVLLILCVIVTADAASNGFAGVTSGEVPLWTLNIKASGQHVAEAFALIGFSFYVHPLMMPLLSELPPGEVGVHILRDAATTVIMGVALIVYSYIGGMGAAAFGSATKGDIMMNKLISSPVLAAAFVIMILVYLSSCIPPLVLSLRCYIDFIVAGPRAGFRYTRFLTETLLILGVPMALAWHNPSLSERAFALTGATGVCIVCYVIPVVAHVILLAHDMAIWVPIPSDEGTPHDHSVAAALLAESGSGLIDSGSGVGSTPPSDGSSRALEVDNQRDVWGFVQACILPILVLLIGCGFSGVALYGAIYSIVHPNMQTS